MVVVVAAAAESWNGATTINSGMMSNSGSSSSSSNSNPNTAAEVERHPDPVHDNTATPRMYTTSNISSSSSSSSSSIDSPTLKVVVLPSTSTANTNNEALLSDSPDPDNHAGGSSNSSIGSSSQHHHQQHHHQEHHQDTRLLERAKHHFASARYYSGHVINDNRVQLFIVSLIAINAIMMGIGTFDFVKDNPTVDRAFEIIDQTFLVIFTIELGMQAFYHGWRMLLDGWLVFDLVIIVTSWSFAGVQIIRAFRIFRALRLITRIKVMKNLVLALFSVIPRMFAIALLLFLVSYIFAVMFTQLFKDLYDRGVTHHDYFGRIDNTFFTLFQIMTLDAWADIARQVMSVYAWAWLPFVVFVIVTGFVVVNLIIAVICDAISALHDDEKAKLHGTFGDDEEETTSNESVHPAVHQDVREQLGVLENHVEELTKMQEQTLHSLALLTRQIQLKRLQRSQRQLHQQQRELQEQADE